MRLPPGILLFCLLVQIALGATIAPGLSSLEALHALPAFKESLTIGAVTSYDRKGGNDDGFSGTYSFVREDSEGLILADLKGPGIIYRIWTPTPLEDTIEFLFDGETTPRIALKYRELFLGKHPAFPRPLVGFGAGGYYSYVPIPYEKSCIVRLRAPKTQFYQINYATYGQGAGIRTFTAQRSDAEQAALKRAIDLLKSTGKDLSSRAAPAGAGVTVARTNVTLKPRSLQKVFETKKGGRIVGLRFGPAGTIASKARDLILRISFDAESPAVLCPLGDFFGYAWGEPAMESLLLGTSGNTNYCYFPMPFDRSATVEVLSERETPAELWAEIAHTTQARHSDEGKFYAIWKRENPTKIGEPYSIIQTEGRGHLVGVILQSQGFESGKTLFFEGDDQTTIDGQLVVHGTGSEDFFNGGWYDVPDRWEKRISFPLSGCLGYAKHLGRTGAYRFLLGDAYPYKKSLLQTIEHAGEKNSIPTDYCSVSFLYSDSPIPPQMSHLKDRAVQDLDEVIFPAFWQLPIYAWSFENASLTRKKAKIGGEEIRFLSLSASGQDWFGPHFLSPVCNVPSAGIYEVYVDVLKGPAQARIQLFQNENPVAEPVDLFGAEAARANRLLLGKLPLVQGDNNLMIKLVGKHNQSTGLGLDLVHIICARQK